MKIWEKHRKRQWIGFYSGGYLAAFLTVIGLSGLFMDFNKKGPMNVGHENISCDDCHQKAPGTLRQQLQSKVSYLLETRQTDAVFGHLPVSNQDCLFCHERANDPHPVYRFIEPRFVEKRKKIKAQYCSTCHKEHTGLRITNDTQFCQYCHEKLSIKKDLIDIPHTQLIKDKKWTSCLGCHDYHGNHIYTSPRKTSDMIPEEELIRYFKGLSSPYSKEKKNEPLKKRH